MAQGKNNADISVVIKTAPEDPTHVAPPSGFEQHLPSYMQTPIRSVSDQPIVPAKEASPQKPLPPGYEKNPGGAIIIPSSVSGEKREELVSKGVELKEDIAIGKLLAATTKSVDEGALQAFQKQDFSAGRPKKPGEEGWSKEERKRIQDREDRANVRNAVLTKPLTAPFEFLGSLAKKLFRGRGQGEETSLEDSPHEVKWKEPTKVKALSTDTPAESLEEVVKSQNELVEQGEEAAKHDDEKAKEVKEEVVALTSEPIVDLTSAVRPIEELPGPEPETLPAELFDPRPVSDEENIKELKRKALEAYQAVEADDGSVAAQVSEKELGVEESEADRPPTTLQALTSEDPLKSIKGGFGGKVVSVGDKLQKAGQISGSKHIAATGKLVKAIGAIVASFEVLDKALSKASANVAAFAPEILVEQVSRQLMILEKRMERGAKVGGELGAFEKEKTDLLRVVEDIKTVLIEIAVPIAIGSMKVLKVIAHVLLALLQIVAVIMKVIVALLKGLIELFYLGELWSVMSDTVKSAWDVVKEWMNMDDDPVGVEHMRRVMTLIAPVHTPHPGRRVPGPPFRHGGAGLGPTRPGGVVFPL